VRRGLESLLLSIAWPVLRPAQERDTAMPCDVSSSLVNDYWLPTEGHIIDLHRELIEEGQLAGLRDSNLLNSAIARPLQLLAYCGDQPVHILASAVAIGLVKNHPFADGNKRVGLAVLDMILSENGYSLSLSQDEAVDLFEGIAKADHEGGLTDAQFIDVVANSCQPFDFVNVSYKGYNGLGEIDINFETEANVWHAHAGICNYQTEVTARTYKLVLDKAWDALECVVLDDDQFPPEM
jgi:death on curing protein